MFDDLIVLFYIYSKTIKIHSCCFKLECGDEEYKKKKRDMCI